MTDYAALHPTLVAVVNAADRLIHENGRTTIRDVRDAVGLHSTSAVHRRLTQARDLGLLDWTPGRSGTIRMTVERRDRSCCRP